MNIIGLYGAIGWNVLISDNPKSGGFEEKISIIKAP